MIEDLAGLNGEMLVRTEVAVVGAGPAGIVTALELARRGIDVVVVESGAKGFQPALQDLSEANDWDRERHAPLSLAIRRQLGGTSTIWGGRCVPYDPIDFETRPVAGSAPWPVGFETMRQYFQRACDWFFCGRAVFDAREIPHAPLSIVPGLSNGEITSTSLERWSLPTDFGKKYGEELGRSPKVRVLTGLTCTEVVCDSESRRAAHLRCRSEHGGTVRVEARQFVLACGGLEGTRLLMDSTGPQGGRLGDHSSQLGRWYMAHVEGVISKVVFSTPPRQTVYGYERDADGVYVRRRFAFSRELQLREGLPNVVGWLGNPDLPDARHGSGPLSFVYLALTSPLGPKLGPEAQRMALTGENIPGTPYGPATQSPKLQHLRNLAREPWTTGRFVVSFGARRFLVSGRRAPGFFVYNRRNEYPFQYHGEHLPSASSVVTQSRATDVLGRHRLDIDLRFSSSDVDGIVRAHELWDTHLRSAGVGRLEYLHDDRRAAVESRMGGGFHQVGTTRMSASASGGVVDQNLGVHGVPNLALASSSTFVTSGQANSTFMIVVFALRLADRLHDAMTSPAMPRDGGPG